MLDLNLNFVFDARKIFASQEKRYKESIMIKRIIDLT